MARGHVRALGFRQPLQRGRLDVNGDPFGAQTSRKAAAGANRRPRS